jgi:hypothetical protein
MDAKASIATRRLPAKGTAQLQERSIVAVERVDGDVRLTVRRALAHAEWQRVIPKGATVSLKVNLGWDQFIPGSITSPLFAEALILADYEADFRRLFGRELAPSWTRVVRLPATRRSSTAATAIRRFEAVASATPTSPETTGRSRRSCRPEPRSGRDSMSQTRSCAIAAEAAAFRLRSMPRGR